MTRNCPVAIPILLALILFGYGYNKFVEHLENGGHDHGYMSIIVVFGCTVTLLGGAIATSLTLEQVLTLFLCFAASGMFMALGSFARHCHQRTRDRNHANDAIKEQLDT